MFIKAIIPNNPLTRTGVLVLENCWYNYNESKIHCDEKERKTAQLILDWTNVETIYFLTKKLLRNQTYRGNRLSHELVTPFENMNCSVKQNFINPNEEKLLTLLHIPNLFHMCFVKFYDYLMTEKGVATYGKRWVVYRLTTLKNVSHNRKISFNRKINKIDDFWLADISINFGKKIFIIDIINEDDQNEVQYIGCLSSLIENLKYSYATNIARFPELMHPRFLDIVEVKDVRFLAPVDKSTYRPSSNRNAKSTREINPMGLLRFKKDPLFDWNTFKIILEYCSAKPPMQLIDPILYDKSKIRYCSNYRRSSPFFRW